MAKFTKAWQGVPAGEIYPVDYAEGEACPAELLAAAILCEVVDGKAAKAELAKAMAEAAADGSAT